MTPIEVLGIVWKPIEWILNLVRQKRRDAARAGKETARRAKDQARPLVEQLAADVNGLLATLGQDPCPIWIHVIEQNEQAGVFSQSPKLVAFSKMLDRCQLPVFCVAGLDGLGQELNGTMSFLYWYSRCISEWHITLRDHLARVCHYTPPMIDPLAARHVFNWYCGGTNGHVRQDIIYYTVGYANRIEGSFPERVEDAINDFHSRYQADIECDRDGLQSCLRETLKVFGFTHPVICNQAAVHLRTLQPQLLQLRDALTGAMEQCFR